jgi:hypothetical protein
MRTITQYSAGDAAVWLNDGSKVVDPALFLKGTPQIGAVYDHADEFPPMPMVAPAEEPKAEELTEIAALEAQVEALKAKVEAA